MIDYRWSAAIAALFVALGAGGLAAPRLSARQYGLPTADPAALALVRACGARDLVLGGILFTSLGDARAVRRVLGWATLAALADAAAVFSVRGVRPQHVLHLAGFAALAATAALGED